MDTNKYKFTIFAFDLNTNEFYSVDQYGNRSVYPDLDSYYDARESYLDAFGRDLYTKLLNERSDYSDRITFPYAFTASNRTPDAAAD
jgi:hypothetical protein